MTCRFYVVLALVGLLIACDQDPFRQRERPVLNGYELEQFEDGQTYYLVRSGDQDQGGGVVGGTVVSIGWNDRYIVVMRKATFGGDKDGWMVIDTTSGVISGPLSEAEMRQQPQAQVNALPAADAWKQLRR